MGCLVIDSWDAPFLLESDMLETRCGHNAGSMIGESRYQYISAAGVGGSASISGGTACMHDCLGEIFKEAYIEKTVRKQTGRSVKDSDASPLNSGVCQG